MARLNEASLRVAHDMLSRYPVPKSATIPLCHLAQEQDGYLSQEAMVHIAELVGCSAAEVLGTASFYDMFKREPVGRYHVNICTQLPCMLLGADELLEHAAHTLGIHPGQTTPDGVFTIEGVECVAACTEAPCATVNYRYFHKISAAELDQVFVDLRATGKTSVPTRSNDRGDEIPLHGTLATVRQRIGDDRRAGNAAPVGASEPVWLSAAKDEAS